MLTIKERFKFLGGMVLAVLALASWTTAQGTGNAPERPTCTEEQPCRFNETNGVGAGVRVILFDPGGGHGNSKRFLREAMERLQEKYGFIYTRKNNINDLTDNDLNNAKVIIYSSTDGNVGGAIPNSTVRGRVENFVEERGWGMLMVHAACAFIDSWPFHQDACIQQYFHHNNSGTQAVHYIENRTVDNQAHGLANPYTNFLLENLNVRETMRDEWYTWRGNPRTTHQYNRQSFNKIMLTALDEGTYSSPSPRYPDNHYTAWTHTMGEGVVIYNSIGHDDLWRINDEQHGEELLWRMIRYVAKDWGPSKPKVCTDELAGNEEANFDPETMESDPATCMYCGDEGYEEYVAGKDESQYDDQYCEIVGVNIAGFRVNDFITTDKLNINVTHKGEYNLQVVKTNGEVALDLNGFGPKEYPNAVKEAGIYYVKLSAPGYKTHVKKLLVK